MDANRTGIMFVIFIRVCSLKRDAQPSSELLLFELLLHFYLFGRLFVLPPPPHTYWHQQQIYIQRGYGLVFVSNAPREP